MDQDRFQEILRDWRGRVDAVQRKESDVAEKLGRWHYRVGVPCVIAAAVTGTAAFVNLADHFGLWARLTVAVLSVLTAILAASQTFLNFGKRSEGHNSSCAQLGQIRRQIDVLLSFPPETPEQKRLALDQLNEQIHSVARTMEPLVVHDDAKPGGGTGGPSGGGGGGGTGRHGVVLAPLTE